MGAGGATAQAVAHKACPIDMYKRAESSLFDMRDSWPALLEHQSAFSPCDDGALAEGYSDAVVTNFAHRWDQFSVFLTLSKKDPTFRRWAIRHIDATASDEDLKKIMLNANACSGDAGAKSLCETIHQAAEDALTELKQQAAAPTTMAPDCSGPDHWAAGTAFSALKNEGAVTNDTVDFDHVTSITVASEQIGKDLWRQVFRVTFPLRSGDRVEAIVVADASSEECSMSGGPVFLISKAL